MAERLVVVSNRIPTGDTPSGGLVVALGDMMAQRGGIWIGAHPDTGVPSEDFEKIGTDPFTRLAFRLTPEEHENYYLGFANSVLWPLCHRRGDLVELRREYERDYLGVNRRLAGMIASILQPDDLIWVHDYHLVPLAAELRRLGVENRIGFFLHIPFPSLPDLSVLPKPEDFAGWMARYDLLGLQTQADVARCLEMYRADPRAEFMRDGTVKFGSDVVSVRSFPIGIDVEDFARAAAAEGPNPFGGEQPGEYIIGVDRLDYSKGLPNRFRAFGTYLEKYAGDRRPCLIQIAPPTRESVKAYRDITQELEEIAGRLNGAFAALDWTPVRYIHRAVEREHLARLHRGARAAMVTSLADGMNLVAKEFVAAQDPEDPGVLILSKFTGAAEHLTEALLVNPYDVSEMADAIRRALDMPLDERKRRHAACLEAVRATNVGQWSTNFIGALERCVPALRFNLEDGEDSEGDRTSPLPA
jgi:trehalose 6-phosphate synthase